MREKILQVIYRAIDKVNEDLSEEDQVDKKADTVLMGDAAAIDSLGLLTLMIELEKNIAEEFNAKISLLEEEGIGEDEDFVLSVADLADRVQSSLKKVSTGEH